MAEKTRNRHLYRPEYNKKGDMPGQVILEKHNGYKEVLNKAALDKSKEIAAEGIVSWSAANWMESEYPYLTRKEADGIGKNLVKKASPLVAGGFYLYGIQENHERFKSPYNAFKADILDVLPISAGMLGGAVGMYFGGPVGAFGIGILMTGVVDYRVEQYKLEIERKEAEGISDEKRANT